MRTTTVRRGNPSVLEAVVVLSLLGAVSCGELPDGKDQQSVVGKVAQAWTARKFGSYGSQDFALTNGQPWLVTLDYQWDLKSNFITNLDDTDTVLFSGMMPAGNDLKWYDTQHHGSGVDLGTGGIDTVDLFFAQTHGGDSDQSSSWAMYPVNQHVFSNNMRLGDDGGLCSIFTIYACDSMVIDGHWVTRWRNAFRGGLRIALGNPDLAGAGHDELRIGNAYADYLQAGYGIWYAWYYATTVETPDNPGAATATGSNEDNCFDRLWGMTWQNFKDATFPRLRDGNIGIYCSVEWP